MAAAKRELNPFDNTEPEEKQRVAVVEPPNDDTEIQLSDAQTEGDDDEEEPAAAGGETRAEKKRNRWKEHADRAANLEKELAAERAARSAEASANQARVDAALEQSRQALAALTAQRGEKQNQPDPLDEQEANARREEQHVYREYELRVRDAKNPLAPKEQAEYEKRLQDARDRIMDVRVERKLRGIQPAQQQQQGNPAAEAIRAQIIMRHPELAASQAAQLHVDGLWRTKLATGKPNDYATMEEALEETDKLFKFGKYKNADARTPDPSLKDKLTGQPRGGAAGATEMPKSLTMTSGLKRLADKAYTHIKDPKERYTKWAREVGAELIRDGVDLSQYR